MPVTAGVSTRLAVAFAAAGAVAALAGAGCSGSSGNAQRGASLTGGIKDLQATVDPGKPAAPAADGYVGSLRCIGCHGGTYASYEKTAHARGLRTAGRPKAGPLQPAGSRIAVWPSEPGSGAPSARVTRRLAQWPTSRRFSRSAS